MRMNVAALNSMVAAFCSLCVLLTIVCCSNDDEHETCSEPAESLDGTACEMARDSCIASNSHPCCEGYSCGCRTNRSEAVPEFIWVCGHYGCADDAEECSGICDIRPSTPGCLSATER